MCGIAGIIRTDTTYSSAHLQQMLTALAHRGPDGWGIWADAQEKVLLGHRRLSIIDLQETAGQPMHYLDRYTIVFNGEIYNYIELKAQLLARGYRFLTDSDTEVLLALYDLKQQDCLADLDGMFAFVIYDRQTGACFCARDRFGEKPFYYHRDAMGNLLFASEIKALWAAGVPKVVNERMRFNYLLSGALSDTSDNGATFYSNVRKLPQSSCFEYRPGQELKIRRYWTLDHIRTDTGITDEAAIERFRELFTTSVKRRMRSDVPLGSSLSGGLDSSLIVSVLDRLDSGSDIRRKTFSARFPEFEKDESRYQDMVIARTNTEAHFVYPDAGSMLANLPRVIHAQDEPFGSASICAAYEVFKLAKDNGVTVMLDGQGADEILCGYHGYFSAYFSELFATDKRKYHAEYQAYLALHADNRINEKVGIVPWKKMVTGLPGMEFVKRRRYLRKQAKPRFSPEYYAAYADQTVIYKDGFRSLDEALKYGLFSGGLEELMRYVDRNSMAHSLEVRLPFLFHELVAFVFTLPPDMKIRQGWTKWLQRKAFPELMPPEITWRKDKIGYEPPQQKWLSSPEMSGEIEAIRQRLTDDRILNPAFPGYKESGMSWRLLMTGKILSV